jgi:glycosyltransferase involved in cell wall biosynthesis
MEPSKVFVVRSAPERARWSAGVGDPVWKRGHEHLVGYVGVMGEQEGLDLLLQAAAIIVHERGRRDVYFLLIGDGTERTNLERMTHDMGLSDHVEFTGRIDDSDLISALSAADVLVNPDRPSELNDKSTMNKIVEYMAVGRPIVQFDTTEGRFSAGDSSLYPAGGDVGAFAEAILAVIDDPARARAMGAAGRERFETVLCWEHQRGPLLAAYAAALGGSAPAQAYQQMPR